MGDLPLRLDLTSSIVSAYVKGHAVPSDDLARLIAVTETALAGLGQPPMPAPEIFMPAIDPRRSVRRHGITCLHCGRIFKTLKRHIGAYGLTPEAYRARYNLAVDYPMATRAYVEARSALSKRFGLGRHVRLANLAKKIKRVTRPMGYPGTTQY